MSNFQNVRISKCQTTKISLSEMSDIHVVIFRNLRSSKYHFRKCQTFKTLFSEMSDFQNFIFQNLRPENDLDKKKQLLKMCR